MEPSNDIAGQADAECLNKPVWQGFHESLGKARSTDFTLQVNVI